MTTPNPYGLFVYGGELSDDDLGFIDHQCKRLLNFKEISQLESLKQVRELPDGGFVVIYHTGGNFRSIAYKGKKTEQPNKLDGIVTSRIPMLFSGSIDQGIAYQGKGIEINLTEMCAKRLMQYENVPLIKSVELQRFRCEYQPLAKAMFVPQALQYSDPSNVLYTQYHMLKAGWFSGAMAEVVQIVSGFGRQDFINLPDNEIERIEMLMPAGVLQAIEAELGEQVRLPGYSGVVNVDGQIQYGFYFTETNVVSFDNENNPWLIQVEASGVWAMPLPVIPATRTKAFHDYITSVGDTEILKILERFGAIPSGETFPEGADFYRWVRAGTIIRVCDSSDYFNRTPYSTVMGWSTDTQGKNLINTCYDYIEDRCYGFTYQIRLDLGPAINQGWLGMQTIQADNPASSRVSRYLSELFTELSDPTDPLTVSIKYKIRRVPMDVIESRASANGASDVEYWDNFVCDPIANHSGHVTCSNTGPLFGGFGFKVPEPFFEGCIHMNFSAKGEAEDHEKCDTIIYAYHSGDTLKVIKNFHDGRGWYQEIEGNFEDIMIVGAWEQTEYSGQAGLQGQFYSTEFDNRKELAPRTTYTKIVGQDKGYGEPSAFYPWYGAMDGILIRDRYYTHHKVEKLVNNESIATAFVIPFCLRDAAIYACTEGNNGGETTETMRMYSVRDPYQYNYWTYDFVWHSISSGGKRTGRPYPVDGFPIWAEDYEYMPNERSDFADQGPWIPGLPAEVSDKVNTPTSHTLLSKIGKAPTVDEYTIRTPLQADQKYQLRLSMYETPKLIHTEKHPDVYYSLSPDRWGNVMFEDGCKVIFGSVNYCNISVKMPNGNRYRFGYSAVANNEHAHTFIGVINE